MEKWFLSNMRNFIFCLICLISVGILIWGGFFLVDFTVPKEAYLFISSLIGVAGLLIALFKLIYLGRPNLEIEVREAYYTSSPKDSYDSERVYIEINGDLSNHGQEGLTIREVYFLVDDSQSNITEVIGEKIQLNLHLDKDIGNDYQIDSYFDDTFTLKQKLRGEYLETNQSIKGMLIFECYNDIQEKLELECK